MLERNYFNGLTKESLRHQKDGKIKNLEKALTVLFNKSRNKDIAIFFPQDLKRCERAIAKAFGLNVKCTSPYGRDTSISVQPPMITSQVIIDKESEDEAGPWGLPGPEEGEDRPLTEEEQYVHEIFLDTYLKVEPGYIDRENIFVKGAFAKVPSQLFLPPEWIAWEIKTARELTAVVLHELGHIFATLTMVDHIAAGNVLINQALRQKDEHFKPINVVQNGDFSKLKGISDKKEFIDTVRTIVHTLVVRSTPQSLHHTSVNENMADNFVAKFEYVADSLDFLSRFKGDLMDMDTMIDWSIYEAVQVLRKDGDVEKQLVDFTTISIAATARKYNLFTYRPIRERILLNLNAASARIRSLKKYLKKKETLNLIASYERAYAVFKELRVLPDEVESISKLLRSTYITSRNIEEIEVLSEFLLDNPLVIAAAKLRLK